MADESGGGGSHKAPAPVVTVMKAKSASSLRWAILVCASLLMLSNYYVYDVPASLYVAWIDYGLIGARGLVE